MAPLAVGKKNLIIYWSSYRKDRTRDEHFSEMIFFSKCVLNLASEL